MLTTIKSVVMLGGSTAAALMSAHVLMCLAIVALSVIVMIALHAKFGPQEI